MLDHAWVETGYGASGKPVNATTIAAAVKLVSDALSCKQKDTP
jgi:hypothetical protein